MGEDWMPEFDRTQRGGSEDMDPIQDEADDSSIPKIAGIGKSSETNHPRV
jgi:hypothetical protein